MSMTTYEGRISRPLAVRIFPEVTAEEAALLMSTAQSSSSSLDETSCVSVLLSVLQTPAPLPRVVAGSQGYTQRRMLPAELPGFESPVFTRGIFSGCLTQKR